jgi:hypothetical protein
MGRVSTCIPGFMANTYQISESSYIKYSSYEQLKRSLQKHDAIIHEAFYPMQIDHHMLRRAMDTKKPLTPKWNECPEPVERFLKKHIESWGKTAECQKLERLIKLVENHEITKVINIASGCMEFGMDMEDFNRSAAQHALTIMLHKSLQKRTKNTIQFYAQDPRYTAVDILTLSLHGCEVLEDPQALIEIDNDSVVFACCPGFPLSEITADLARPAMLIWDSDLSSR